MVEQNKDINMVAMEVILHAGNGRELIDKALAKMSEFSFEEADTLLQEAEKEVVQAHIAQTQVIQGQVSGEQVEYSLLFIHAQDTIMTINTEFRMSKKMLPIMKALYEQTKNRKEQTSI